MLPHQQKSDILPAQNPDIAKMVHFHGMFRGRRLHARHVANDRAILLAQWFHNKWIH
ncbi:hypothetical protein UUU_16150 [Klebsiella pneumoniae subsp. pneumoniae DSM 30104 = JCM 1662 = NBRC 14940]|nr:hypothetical protein UUU_16150 [Klebsiella pneumoniae subsp. pneumoniae DSM 30104 = JCM 1662 = NBRC 14940]